MWLQLKSLEGKVLLSRIWNSLGAPLPSSKLLGSAGAEFLVYTAIVLPCEVRGAAGTVPAVSHGHLPGPAWPGVWLLCIQQPLQTSSNAFFWVGPESLMYLSSVFDFQSCSR